MNECSGSKSIIHDIFCICQFLVSIHFHLIDRFCFSRNDINSAEASGDVPNIDITTEKGFERYDTCSNEVFHFLL